MSPQELCQKIDSGEYTKGQFVHDAVGFSLAQWTYSKRKEALYDHCKGNIGSIDCQCDFLYKELKEGGNLEKLSTCGSLKSCSDYVMVHVENPKD